MATSWQNAVINIGTVLSVSMRLGHLVPTD